MAQSPSEILANSYEQLEEGGLGKVTRGGIAGVLTTIALSLISGILTLKDLVVQPLTGATEGLANTMESLTGSGGAVLEPAAQASGQSASQFGIFAIGAAIFAFMFGVFVYNRFMTYIGSDLPFTDMNIPGIGYVEESDEED